MPSNVVIYTDGACSGNPGPGGWAAVLIASGKRRCLQGSAPHTTNNRMELVAALEALRALIRPCSVTLRSDSQYLRDGMTRWLSRWKQNGFKTRGGEPVKNGDLWLELDQLASRHSVSWEWVRGHAGDFNNELCDSLAKEALENRTMQPYPGSRLRGETPPQPTRAEPRTIVLPDGRSQEVEAKVYDPAWAVGSSRQVHGRKGNKLRN